VSEPDPRTPSWISQNGQYRSFLYDLHWRIFGSDRITLEGNRDPLEWTSAGIPRFMLIANEDWPLAPECPDAVRIIVFRPRKDSFSTTEPRGEFISGVQNDNELILRVLVDSFPLAGFQNEALDDHSIIIEQDFTVNIRIVLLRIGKRENNKEKTRNE